MGGGHTVLLIDGEWLLPRRPRAGRWILGTEFDATAIVDCLLATVALEAPVRRIQCFRNWADHSLGQGGAIHGALQRRLVELHHVPARGVHSEGYLTDNRDGISAAIRAASMEQLLHDRDARIAIASDRQEAVAGLPPERIRLLDLPVAPALWKAVTT
ncbi:hypothetical protein C3B59_17365 [Cryobacterium zongtaii]|uniref:Uncharacterized protein n=1 Tax=Cryobacterium zongtaii TaxID=1259217 RepID=A0A2S3Z620_9MICO|nr:hypothetical protein [Cryobacterium zongtaii]POH59661.1 hypothetical protein C3B59_17365 [Cryobacterium zongtaii]